MNKLLILGANGFIGEHLQEYVVTHRLDKQYEIIGADLTTNPHSPFTLNISNLLKIEELKYLLLSVRPEYILNLAGILKSDTYEEFLACNAGITRNMLELITRDSLPVKKIVLIGSAAEYGKTDTLPLLEHYPLRPINYYGLSKVIQSQYAQYYYLNNGLPICIARIFNLIGKKDSPHSSFGAFKKQITEAKINGVITTGNLHTERDFVFIDDVLRAILSLLKDGHNGEVYNVCSGVPIKMHNVLELMIAASGKKLFIETDPQKVRIVEILSSVGSYQKILDHTGWKPEYDITRMIQSLKLK
jgi:GDP-4-dehydro-6-deoxy-D-mannose reductase